MESSTAVLTDRVPLVAPADAGDDARPRQALIRRVGAGRFALAILVVAAVAGLGYLRAWPPVATVMSGSMSPTIDTGDVVVMKRVDRPRVGDIVAVKVPDEARSRFGYPPEVIHRVVRIGPDGRVTTKGDARRENDPFTVPQAALDTKVVTTLPAAGRALAFLTSTLGLIWIGLGALLLVVMPLFDRQRELQEREHDGIEELGSDVQAVFEEVVRLRAAVDAEASARASLEQTLRDLSAAAEAIRAEVSREPEPEPGSTAPGSTAPVGSTALGSTAPVEEPTPAPVPPPPTRRRTGGLVGRARDWLS